jgi:tetratricopeptide (TPR) repeat protein
MPGQRYQVPAPMLRFRDIPEGVRRWIPPLVAAAAAGRPGEALEAHRMAVALDSTRVEGYNGYGIALLQTGDLRGAYEVFRRGIAVHPESARLRFNARTAAMVLGDTAAAIAQFQETVNLDSTAVRAAEKAAILLEAKGDTAAAVWYKRAATAGSSDAKAWLAGRGMIQERVAR